MKQIKEKRLLRKKKYSITKNKTKKKLPKSAITNHITGLYNRRYFDKFLKKIIGQSKKQKRHFSLLIIDVDNFKIINDKYGHLAGDKILTDLARVFKASVRKIDICFRYGGNEIAIILPNSGKEAAENIITRLETKLDRQKFAAEDGYTLRLQLSVGLAIFPDDGLIPRVLIEKADKLLYKAKRRKKRQKSKPAEPFILKTKLVPPILKDTVVFRPRLLSLLKENIDKKLILVNADAGYGKTTLLTQLIQDQDLPVVFYDLDKGDNDLMVFFSYLIKGLEQLQPNLVQRTSGLLEHGAELAKNYELVMGTLINELMEKRSQELFFILDDYHTLLDDSLVHNALDYFINHLPDTVRVVIASRTVPQLTSLAKWRSKQNLFELSREELRFTHNEIKALLSRVYKVILSDEELSQVSNHTEGWITGIQLILQSAGKERKTVKEILNGYVAQNRPLFEYFANEILTGESSRVQNFLKYSSILEIMTPNACDAILGMKDSARLLRDIERRNLFLSTVGKEEYKYHHVFREFLQDRIEDKRFKRSLNLKAARFYKQKGQIEQAIQHYLEVESYEWAGKLIVQVANQMRTQARFATLNTWLKEIPEVVLQKQPQLLTALGRLYVVQGHLKQAEEMYIRAEQLLKDKGNMPALAEVLNAHGSLLLLTGAHHEKTLKILRKAIRACPASEEELRGEIFNSTGRMWRAVWDFKKARTYLLKAYRISEHMKDSRKLITIGNNLALQFLTQGESRTAFKSFVSLIKKIGETYWIEVGVIFTNAARTALTLGKVEWAEQCLDKGWNLCRPYEDPFSKAALNHGFGALYTLRDQWDLAEQHLHKALNGFAKLQWAHAEFTVLLLLTRLYRYSGDLAKAEEYLGLIWQRLDKKQSPYEASILAESSLLQASLGQFDKADKIIKTNLRLIQKFGLNLHKFLSYFVATAVYLSKNNERDAVKFLRRTLRLAKIKGFDGLLACELRHKPYLAKFAQSSNIDRNFILSLNLPKDMPKLEIQVRCFGGLRLQDKIGKVLRLVWPTEKTRSLFALLVAHRETLVRRDVLMEQLWPNLSKRRAIQNFRTTASRMRQSLIKALSGQLSQNEIFVWQHGRYQLLPEVQLQVDIEEFNLLLKEAERAGSGEEKATVIHQALNLYKGDYLPEIYDSWSDVFRRRFRERRLSALYWLAQYTAGQGDDYGCIAACESYLSADPLSEEVVRLYMKSLSRLGRVTAVKACYKSLNQALRRELSSAPSKETKDLYLFLLGSHSKL